MKRLLILVLVMAAGYFSFCQISEAEKKGRVTSMQLIRAPMYTRAPFAGTCSGFEQRWKAEDLDTFDIVDAEDQARILEHMSMSILWSNYRPYADTIDPKAKIYVHYTSGAVDSLCISGAQLFALNGEKREFVDPTIDDWITMLPDSNSVAWKREHLR